MDDMDFTKPLPAAAPAAPSAPFKAAQSRFYNAKLAEQLFRDAGREERLEAGKVLFVEADAAGGMFSLRGASRMFYLVEGEVGITMGGRPLDVVKAGEVFGEMAVISGRPRSATATAKTAGTAWSLDAAELQGAIARAPEFALMLMSVLFDRLRFIAARLVQRKLAPGSAAREATAFEPELLARLESVLSRSAVTRYPQTTIIMKEGQVGKFMYVVKSGKVAIAIGSNIVEVVGPGGTFGEMALVDQSPRTARAGAVDETELLAFDRESLLKAVKAHPDFGIAMLRSVADRLRHMNSLLA